MRRHTAVVTIACALAGCGGGGDTVATPAESTASTGPSTITNATTESLGVPSDEVPTDTVVALIPSADGRYLPIAANEPAGLAAQITAAEQAIRDPATPAAVLADLGHEQQVLYRHLGRHPDWDADVLAAVPSDLQPIIALQLRARRAFYNLVSGYGERLPAWRIEQPEPAEMLLGHYQEAEADYGIEWEYLAAINLVETGMGRIVGLSTAGAQGPMQFIPATWADYGEGDINNPRDAIRAAARYLVSRGGPDDMDRALFGYNNSEHYVEGVSRYADIMRADPAAYLGFYNWEIHFSSYLGDLWLPVGYEYENPILITEYLAEHPESRPPPNGWVPEIPPASTTTSG